MNSTDHNINHPFKIGQINLTAEMDAWKIMAISMIDQEHYDKMKIHDPLTCYIISDAKDGRIYYGDALVMKGQDAPHYLLSLDPETNEFILHMNVIFDHSDHIVNLMKFDDPQKAIDALYTYKNIGYSPKIGLKLAMGIYLAIGAFVTHDINLHECIIGIMSMIGFKNDPRLQEVINLGDRFDIRRSDRDIPKYMLDVIVLESRSSPTSLIALYLNIYNEFVKADFLNRYSIDTNSKNLDFSKEIGGIIHAYEMWKFAN